MCKAEMGTNLKSSRGRLPNGAPNPVDIHVGRRIRLRRELLGLSQEKLARLLGLTFQQIQKYERGMNRVGASRLWDIANLLKTSINYFYDEMDEETKNSSPGMINGGNIPKDKKKDMLDIMEREETCELVKAYYKIRDRKTARNIHKLMCSMSKRQINFDEDNDE